MIDIRQSPMFARFMQDLGWKVEKVDQAYAYLRKFPLAGCFAKIPRPQKSLSIKKVTEFKKNRHIFRLKIAPHLISGSSGCQYLNNQFLQAGFTMENFPFNPTTTIQIPLTRDTRTIFNNFTQAKRRAVRRAIKNNIIVKESADIDSFIRIRKKQYFPTGFLIANEMKMLWQNFYPKHAILLLAYKTGHHEPENPQTLQNHALAEICRDKAVAGILMLIYKQVAYYWYASSLSEGKKLFAPTLLVWEALKSAKRRTCKVFDFEGICDERFPKASESWKGFTKFKEGFGGQKVIFSENFSL